MYIHKELYFKKFVCVIVVLWRLGSEVGRAGWGHSVRSDAASSSGKPQVLLVPLDSLPTDWTRPTHMIEDDRLYLR